MDSETKKRTIQDAIARKAFPPTVDLPEARRHWEELCPLGGLFDRPVVVRVPECLNQNGKPSCVVKSCLCTPRVKEYLQRVVEDVNGKQDLLYVKYQCTGASRSCFSTVTYEYLQTNVETIVHFPYILGVKTGYSKDLLDMVHYGIMSANGLASVVASVSRRRTSRYYKLYTIFSERIRRLKTVNPSYSAASPPSVEQYCSANGVVDSKVLTSIWMEMTSIYSPLCELLMKRMKVRKVLRIDHSVKFCKRLKVWTGSGQREGLQDAKLLLLVQNEIGQIVGRRLTRSENNEETSALLETISPTLSSDPSNELFLVSDNANAVRGMVSNIFGSAVSIKQDPFHLIERISSKLSTQAKQKWIKKQLRSALYTVDRQLRPPEEMEEEFKQVVESVDLTDLSCTEATWSGCWNSNAKQIRVGDLYVHDNDYRECRKKPVRIVATSQLEGFHSALKKLLNRTISVDVGLRILDIFIVRHNLRVGSKFGRNPSFGEIDFVELAKAAILSQGVLPESPQLAFVHHVLSEPLKEPTYRSASSLDFSFSTWMRMFETARVQPERLDEALAASRRHRKTVRELLLKNNTNKIGQRLSKSAFLRLLQLEEFDYESTVGFSLHEYELLRQVRDEQARESDSWSTCPLVTTILFNIVVLNGVNKSLTLRRRSYSTISSKLQSLSADTKGKQKQEESSAKSRPLFAFKTYKPTSESSAQEQELQIELFEALRSSKLFTSRKKVFMRVYAFASRACDGIYPKTDDYLERRWGALKRASNRGAALKIKLKVCPAALAQYAAPQPFSAAVAATQSADSAHGGHPTLAASPAASDLADFTFTSPQSTSAATANDSRRIIGSLHQSNNELPHLQLLQSPPPTSIAGDDLAFFKSMADSIPQAPHKWTYIYGLFRQKYPSSNMTLNALRCRLKEKKQRKQKAAMPPIEVHPPPKKIRATSCPSCQKKRKKCGDGGVNPSCTRRTNTASTSTLDRFFVSE